jgi:hypothetical protein
VKNNTLVLVEIIDGRNLSLGPVTHETKPLNVTISSHTSKVIFNVISSPKNLVIIGLFWLVQLIHKWIGIQGVFILKHHNMRPWSVKPSSETCMAKIKMGYGM